ncbi:MULTISPECIES: ABC transporter substrate-binding protein [Burkholderia]|uniref:ABC transporter substrate-binding protein n=1 Tax=Burkholderia TaxID=32008 RepID=UPI00119BDF48|nr:MULTISPECIES: ABC transporter substrate-binding protein [Burkholderia]MCH7271299.1 ABC transporter substrate-binding protein [Burkholderia gladioli]MDN7735702.1 ABC transporter substrate-binding protein [Burkholderia gladioli]MEB2547530.1 ABC transporter substrate-binding protein [Burkholderia gladioli]TWC77831.1 amino acid ABC transporter substrate-binding protein (PAAT family) [Burkholderia sp. SJZ089]TWD08877.1 amino acid ABC transporter substrate-binding protein (PAAT family) [Burkholde
MKKTLLAATLAALTGFAALAPSLAHADRLDDIKQAGVLRVATFDSNPPFGYVDPASNHIVGLDVDYARALADKLGVKLELQSTNPANRIPFLTSRKVDLVLANFTITDERAKQVDFSIPYFSSGQQFLAKKGVLKSKDQLDGLRIGADKGTTNEIAVREQFPKATVVAYDDTPFAFAALRAGNVQAITQDGPKLVGLLANVPDKQKYEIPPFTITNDYMGVGIPKGEPRLVAFVNDTLKGLEANGTANTIYNRWFGPSTRTPLARTFKIGDKT